MQLDNQQEKAVKTESKKALVIAGAGSGKTRVLTERIVHLVDEKRVSPFEILSFTFTRKAAQEMIKRLESRIKSAHDVNMGTMHGIALDFVMRFGEKLGLKSDKITIYNQWESDFLLKEVARDLGVLKKKAWKPGKKKIDAAFNEYYSTGDEPTDREILPIFKAFMARCRENNALTYGGILIGFEMLVPVIAQHLNVNHIMVDEVQDIDPLQWRIINRLCEILDASLFVCGDISQSIYSFRGACPEYLVEHQKEFDIFKISTNYRSDANIVNAANELIENNKIRIDLEMNPIRGAEAPVVVKSETDSQGVVDLIESINSKAPLENRAIFARNHAFLKKMSILMDDAGINHQYVGKQTALTNSENFRRFHAFLKLLVNPYDNFAFLLIRDVIGLSPVEYSEIRQEAVRDGKSHFQVWRESYTNNNLFDNFFNSNELPFVFQLAALNKVSFLFETEEILRFAKHWQRNNNRQLFDYLKWLAVYDVQDELKEESHGLQLMTVHAAKGLEFDTVIIAGCNEGIIPSKQALGKGELEDERRLMYVAMTRAENFLYLTVRPEEVVSQYGEKRIVKCSPISRFIKEAGLGG